MERRFIFCALCALFGLTAVNAQVSFRDLSLAEALKAAQAEDKLVFVDCYTTWCVPCKKMAEVEFVKPEAGEYFNPKFVSIKINMEKGEGPEVGKNYSVSAYPTFLILKSDGQLQGRLVGSATLDKFIPKVEQAMNEEKGLVWHINQFKAGNRDPQFLRDYMQLLTQNFMRDDLKTVAAELLKGKTGAEIAADKELFATFEAGGFTPFDDLFVSVYKERPTVLANQGEKQTAMLDGAWKTWGLACMKFEGKQYKGFDTEKFEAYKKQMTGCGVPDIDAVVQYILSTNEKYANEKDDNK